MLHVSAFRVRQAQSCIEPWKKDLVALGAFGAAPPLPALLGFAGGLPAPGAVPGAALPGAGLGLIDQATEGLAGCGQIRVASHELNRLARHEAAVARVSRNN